MENSEQQILSVRTSHGPDEVVVEVADTGVGIPPEIQERIFESFFTTRLNGDSSSGLGLHSVKQLLGPYGVRFQVQSRPGRTTFILRIPLEPEGTHA
jgi:signal transduction histidine kinase